MTDALKTVVLDANRTDWISVSVDTLLRGTLRLPVRLFQNPILSRHRVLRRLIGQRYETLSYISDWREAFCNSSRLRVTVVNITNLVEYRRARKVIREADLIVVLHSAAGDDLSLLNQTAHWLQKRRGRLCVFIGNEYELIADKKRFLKESGADYVCSQLPRDIAEWLYADCSNSQVVPMPHALNPDAYSDLGWVRSTDIGFVGDVYDRTIGDTERTALIRYFQSPGRNGLRCDIRLNRRLPRGEWNAFLNECHGIIGGESGSYYLDRNGEAIECAKAYRRKHPDATFEEVFETCFRRPVEFRSGKAVSSRHFEPIGTKTCQLLLNGRYNDILAAEEHYISVRKDLSDIRDAIERFKDETYRRGVVKRAYEHVMSGHTYAHRVRDLVQRMI